MSSQGLAVLHGLPAPALGDRSSGAGLFSARTGILLLALFAASVAFAQAVAAAKPGVIDLLVKWTPLLAQGFLFNLLISVCAMLAGTIAGVMLGFARLSLSKPVRGVAWAIVQFFRNAPWLVLLFFVMY